MLKQKSFTSSTDCYPINKTNEVTILPMLPSLRTRHPPFFSDKIWSLVTINTYSMIFWDNKQTAYRGTSFQHWSGSVTAVAYIKDESSKGTNLWSVKQCENTSENQIHHAKLLDYKRITSPIYSIAVCAWAVTASHCFSSLLTAADIRRRA